MISVIIPLYNKAAFITETIRSVLQQTYSDFELIVVNDGSTDDSKTVVSSITDDRLKLISIPNSGVSIARNTGIENAKFPWVAFLDGDDWWDPDFLKEIFEATTQFPKHRIFTTGRNRVFQDTIEPYVNDHLPPSGETAPLSYYEVIDRHLPIINSSDVVIQKSLLDEVGLFHPGMKMHEDHDLWLRLCLHEKVVYIHKNLSFYRKVASNTASAQVFNASDFLRYMEILSLVREELLEHRAEFQAYADRFLTQCYLKYRSDYPQEDRKRIFQKIQTLISSEAKRKLSVLKLLPVKSMYSIFKKIKG